jgi:hypothetical protein
MICQEAENKLYSNVAHVQIFCQDLLANSITDPNGVCKLMDYLATVFMDKISRFLSTFYVIFWSLVALDVCHLQLTLSQPSNVNATQKKKKTLKEHSPKASRNVSKVSGADLPSFTQNLMQTCCLILPSILLRNTKLKKYS